MARFCPSCGTEVDETAVFCPTCGQPVDQAAEAEIPPAPAWPEPGDAAAPAEPATRTDEGRAAPTARPDEPTRLEKRASPPAPEATRTPPATSAAPRRGLAPIDLPITMPVTLSAWLIGIGTLVAALGVLISLFDGVLNPIELLLLLALLAIAATVFFAARIPAMPHLRLATLVIVLIGFGMALDRLGFGAAGVGELLLFLGTAAAGIGAIILELGRDQPLGGASA